MEHGTVIQKRAMEGMIAPVGVDTSQVRITPLVFYHPLKADIRCVEKNMVVTRHGTDTPKRRAVDTRAVAYPGIILTNPQIVAIN
jgi:hypothetical protein